MVLQRENFAFILLSMLLFYFILLLPGNVIKYRIKFVISIIYFISIIYSEDEEYHRDKLLNILNLHIEY